MWKMGCLWELTTFFERWYFARTVGTIIIVVQIFTNTSRKLTLILKLLMSKRNLLLATGSFSGFHVHFPGSKLHRYFQICPIRKKLQNTGFERCHLGMLGLNLGSTREVTRPGMGWSPVPALWAIASLVFKLEKTSIKKNTMQMRQLQLCKPVS